MKNWKTYAALALLSATSLVCSDARGVKPLMPSPASTTAWDHKQSAALFVGVNRFPDMPLVPYAIDDAVDLAYAFALERKIALVVPHRVVLALSGEPVKQESKERLKKLLAAGARRTGATQLDILRALNQQAAIAEPDGLFIVAVASHGFKRGSTPYVLSSTSHTIHDETLISVPRLLDTVSNSDARRSLVLIDACRAELDSDARGTGRSEAWLDRMKNVEEGQVVLWANNLAYDDRERRNGVFTSGVLDALHCEGNPKGVVTVDDFAQSVEQHVRRWINQHKNPALRAATHISMDVTTKDMPLAHCTRTPAPDAVQFSGGELRTFDEHGLELWRPMRFAAAISAAEAADLDADGANEVLVAIDRDVIAFDPDGKELWRTPLATLVRALAARRLTKHPTRQIVALAGARLTIIDSEGTPKQSLTLPEPMQHLLVDQPTTRSHPTIFIAGGRAVLAFDAKLRAEWSGHASHAVERIEGLDHNHDGRRELAIHTARGRIVVNFSGETIEEQGASLRLRR